MTTSSVHVAPLDWLRRTREGFCGVTVDGSGCSAHSSSGARSGAWTLDEETAVSWTSAAISCLQRCASCAPCRYVSLSLNNRDCSWFDRCELTSLKAAPSGYRTARADGNGAADDDGASGGAVLAQLLDEERRSATAERVRFVEGLARLLPRVDPGNSSGVWNGSDGGEDEAARSAHAGAGGHQLLLALGVLSAPEARERRAAVRHTLRATAPRRGFLFRLVLGTLGPPPPLLRALRAEAAQHGDFVFVPVADGDTVARRVLAAKALAWFEAAARLFPRAKFVAKADLDTLVVVPRAMRALRHALLSASSVEGAARPAAPEGAAVAPAGGEAGAARAGRRAPLASGGERAAARARRAAHTQPMLVGIMQTASFDTAAAEVCGCCGYSLRMARRLWNSPKAVASPCNRTHRAIEGPFYFAIGPWYALSRGALDWLASKPSALAHAHAAAARLGAFASYGEEIFVGWTLSHCPGLAAVQLAPGAVHNYFDKPGIGPSCMQHLNLTVSELRTGHPARWERVVRGMEWVSPSAVGVHAVRTAAEWRRAWALAEHWTRVLAAMPRADRQCAHATHVRRDDGTQISQ